MSMVTDEDAISNDDFNRLEILKGEKLIELSHDDGDLILFFEKHKVTISRQYSEDYGDIIFWEIEKNKKKFSAVKSHFRKVNNGAIKIRAHLRKNKEA